MKKLDVTQGLFDMFKGIFLSPASHLITYHLIMQLTRIDISKYLVTFPEKKKQVNDTPIQRAFMQGRS